MSALDSPYLHPGAIDLSAEFAHRFGATAIKVVQREALAAIQAHDIDRAELLGAALLILVQSEGMKNEVK